MNKTQKVTVWSSRAMGELPELLEAAQKVVKDARHAERCFGASGGCFCGISQLRNILQKPGVLV
jgi:ribosomal protein L5